MTLGDCPALQRSRATSSTLVLRSTSRGLPCPTPLFSRPRLLLLDEPFSAVDAFTRMRLQDLLLDIAKRHHTTLLLVTHDIDEALYLGDRVWVLDSNPGRLVADIGIGLPRPRARDSQALADRRSVVLHALRAVHAI